MADYASLSVGYLHIWKQLFASLHIIHFGCLFVCLSVDFLKINVRIRFHCFIEETENTNKMVTVGLFVKHFSNSHA